MTATKPAPVHRVVTGHDAEGKAIVVSSGAPPVVVEIAALPGTVFHEIWKTSATPAPIAAAEADPTTGPIVLPPPANGTRIRFVDIPPDSAEFLARGAATIGDAFDEIGDRAASTVQADSPHPLMHRTESVDYGIVMEGEIVLVLDDSEVALRRGAVVIQRGTNHAWANRSGRTCRILFIPVDGEFDPALRHALDAR